MDNVRKYEFTGETFQHLGRTLHRIRAIVSFGNIFAGDVGGWVEDEKNLSHYGNAWVFGNARVSGDAQVSGDAWVTPICVTGLKYPVTITDHHMTIGCEFHLISEWREFDDRRIAEMDGLQSSRFWRDHKTVLLAICDANRPNEAEATQ